MIGAATAYNLKKWLNYKVQKVQVLPTPEIAIKPNDLNTFLCFITTVIF